MQSLNECFNPEKKQESEEKQNSNFKISPPISLELLRTYKGFENVSNEKGMEDVKAIETLANILYAIYKKENK